MVQDAGSDPVILRELDASVRAALAGDDVPLLRLAGQANSWNHSPSSADDFSRGAYLAVSCLDYPPCLTCAAARRLRAVHGRGVADDQRLLAALRRLPRLAAATRPPPVPAVKLPASVPILIVGGDLDLLTPLADAWAFGPGSARACEIVTLRSTVHVTSEGDPTGRGHALRAPCDPLVPARRDARRVRGLDPALDVPDYPWTLGAVVPAIAGERPRPGESASRAAMVAAQAFADASIRVIYMGGAASGPACAADASPPRARSSPCAACASSPTPP